MQVSEDLCVIDGAVDGLTPGLHGLNIHELGDLSKGCMRCGEKFVQNYLEERKLNKFVKSCFVRHNNNEVHYWYFSSHFAV